MHCQLALGRARLILNLPVTTSPSLRRPISPLHLVSRVTISKFSRAFGQPRRAFSTDSPDVLFNYTSGRWIVNDALRLSERKREFEVDELCRLAAESVGRTPQDIDTFVKLAEGGFNRIFLITMHDGFEMIARIPFPITVPKFYAVASEAATMRFLRSSGLPIPEVYDYSPSADNAAKTEYIFMEFIRGLNLGDMWNDLEEPEIASVLRQLTQLESRMMSIAFPAGGSLYYAKDLEKKTGTRGIPLKDDSFCVGPDVSIVLWYGRRSQLDVDRGPYENAEAALVAPARKELAYLEKFGRPLLPFRRERRESYGFEEQSPLDHIRNLERYLLLVPFLPSRNLGLHSFRIRHPDLQPGNVVVSKSSPSSGQLEVVSLLDWQHTSILPPSLLAGIPGRFQNHDDDVSHALIPPSLPANMGELDENAQSRAMELYHRRLVHFHYVKNTERYNKLHHYVSSDYLSMFICRLFTRAGAPWEGEPHALKSALLDATEMWESLAGEAVSCPVAFEPEDVRATKAPSERLQLGDQNIEDFRGIIGCGEETWVPIEHHKVAMDLAERLKLSMLTVLKTVDEETQAEATANWLLDDMDEEDYM